MKSGKNIFKQLVENEKVVHALLWGLYLIGIAYSKREPSLSLDELVFAVNYILMVMVVNYVLLPRFFYRKKYGWFVISLLATLTTAMFIEELVLEKIFFPDTRGDLFNPYYGLIEIGTILVFFLGFKLAWDYRSKLQQIDQLEKEKFEGQLNFLKSQINPHFLFNNLNNLYSYALDKSDETPKMILRLSNILRYVLYESQDSFVSLSREIYQIRNYVDLQRLQLEGRGEVHFNVEGKSEGYQIAPLLLFSFIENCFKHSHSSQLDQIKIEISITIENKMLYFKCTNPYNDTPDLSNEELPSGIGLQNVMERLRLLYPKKHQLDMNRDNGVYKVDLELELI
ncbi:histidine kinase [Fulvivirgaceae bacterium BMA10]|uniref:Histidine kinase n=1 Tax=Splendidivirga corallicola TaxID=3051826 RepID=A0ABT8KVW0_9BACT|nr:histidine kinase [Fulvivirgaceae bacterium BMA10]